MAPAPVRREGVLAPLHARPGVDRASAQAGARQRRRMLAGEGPRTAFAGNRALQRQLRARIGARTGRLMSQLRKKLKPVRCLVLSIVASWERACS